MSLLESVKITTSKKLFNYQNLKWFNVFSAGGISIVTLILSGKLDLTYYIKNKVFAYMTFTVYQTWRETQISRMS